MKIFFNPIANIIATQGTKTDIQQQKKDKERKQITIFHNSIPQSPDKSKKKLLKHFFATYVPKATE